MSIRKITRTWCRFWATTLLMAATLHQAPAGAQSTPNSTQALAELKAKLRATTPDPYATLPPPDTSSQWHIGGSRHFQYWTFDVVPGCTGLFSGPGRPSTLGICPAFRRTLNNRWTLTLEPTIQSISHGKAPILFGAIGLRPAIELTLLQGQRSQWPSRIYLSAGPDASLPFLSKGQAPTAFIGAHTGLGIMAYLESKANLTMEFRALVQTGLGANTPTSTEMATPRAGMELHFAVAIGPYE